MKPHSLPNNAPEITPKQSFQNLLDGNRRFVENRSEHPYQTAERRRETLDGQHPFAAVLACSDSRVPPEIIFDQSIGNLFVVRNAGNLLDEITEGSIEYAVEHLHVPLIVVLGHTTCGALTAAVKAPDAQGKIGAVLRFLQGAVSVGQNTPGDPVLNAVLTNIRLSIARLRADFQPGSDELGETGPCVVGGLYRLESGEVEFLSD